MADTTEINTGLQPLAIAITIASPCVALVFVILRLYSRFFITRNLCWDDSLIVVPMILSIGLAYASVEGIKANFLGYHITDIPLDQYDPVLGAKYNYATQLLYNPILALIKNGMLLFFYRLASTIDGLRIFIIGIIVFNTLQMVAIFVTDMLQCVPIQKTFYGGMGSCIAVGDFFIATAALTILTDILVMIIPTWITWNLHLRLRKKIAVIILLSLGAVVTAISVYRMYFLIVTYYGPREVDATYGVGGTASSIEVNLAIVAACGPFLKPLIIHLMPGFFGNESKDRSHPRPNALNYYDPATTRGAAGGGRSHAPARRGTSAATHVHGDRSRNVGFEMRSTTSRRPMTKGSISSTLGDYDDDSRADIVGSGGGGGEGQGGIVKETHINVSVSYAASHKDSEDELLRHPGGAADVFVEAGGGGGVPLTRGRTSGSLRSQRRGGGRVDRGQQYDL